MKRASEPQSARAPSEPPFKSPPPCHPRCPAMQNGAPIEAMPLGADLKVATSSQPSSSAEAGRAQAASNLLQDDGPAESTAGTGRSSSAPSAPSTAQVRSEEVALLKACLRRWSFSAQYAAHQEYRVSYEGHVMELSAQLSALERTHRVVGWPRLLGAGERQQPLEQRGSPYVVGPLRRPVTSLSDLRRCLAEAGEEERPGPRWS